MRTTCIYSAGLAATEIQTIFIEFIWDHLGYIKIVICNHHQPDLYDSNSFYPDLIASSVPVSPLPPGPPDQCTAVSRVHSPRKSSQLAQGSPSLIRLASRLAQLNDSPVFFWKSIANDLRGIRVILIQFFSSQIIYFPFGHARTRIVIIFCHSCLSIFFKSFRWTKIQLNWV